MDNKEKSKYQSTAKHGKRLGEVEKLAGIAQVEGGWNFNKLDGGKGSRNS